MKQVLTKSGRRNPLWAQSLPNHGTPCFVCGVSKTDRYLPSSCKPSSTNTIYDFLRYLHFPAKIIAVKVSTYLLRHLSIYRIEGVGREARWIASSVVYLGTYVRREGEHIQMSYIVGLVGETSHSESPIQRDLPFPSPPGSWLYVAKYVCILSILTYLSRYSILRAARKHTV